MRHILHSEYRCFKQLHFNHWQNDLPNYYFSGRSEWLIRITVGKSNKSFIGLENKRFPKNVLSHRSVSIFIVGLEWELMMPCLFLLSTDESDSEGGNCSLTLVSCVVACKKRFLTFTELFMSKCGHCYMKAGAVNLKCILRIVVHFKQKQKTIIVCGKSKRIKSIFTCGSGLKVRYMAELTVALKDC